MYNVAFNTSHVDQWKFVTGSDNMADNVSGVDIQLEKTIHPCTLYGDWRR